MLSDHHTHQFNPIRLILLFLGTTLFLLLISLVISLENYYSTRFLPNSQVAGISIANQTRSQAQSTLAQELASLQTLDITFTFADREPVVVSTQELGWQHDIENTLGEIWRVDRHNNTVGWWRIIGNYLFPNPALSQEIQTRFDLNHVEAVVADLANIVDTAGAYPSATLVYSGAPGSLQLENGQIGQELDQPQVVTQLMSLDILTQPSLQIELVPTGLELNLDQMEAAQQRALSFVGQQLMVSTSDQTLLVEDTQLIELLQFPEGYNEQKINQVVQDWANSLNRPASDAQFEYQPDTLEVVSFTPPQDGVELQVEPTIQDLVSLLSEFEASSAETKPDLNVVVTVTTTPPTKTLAQTNDLGINELIGFGDSFYKGSIPSRVHNVSHTAQILNNTILQPGEEFSFNQALGEVSSRTGFKPAYVIKGGQTVLGDGGGVCQVSTTLFRSVLDGGLDITRRLPHSYRVGYYEQDTLPGIDATVYSGAVDLRFVNDTPGHVLIHIQADPETQYMTVALYGSSDGRTTEISNHRTWGYQPPLPPQYIPDPNLPPGTTRQIDWAVAGLKTEFTHIIKNAEGEVISEDVYFSNYRPWAAKYLVGQ